MAAFSVGSGEVGKWGSGEKGAGRKKLITDN